MHTLHHGDNLATLKTYPDNHFDSIVTDPPYGIDFLSNGWDKTTGAPELYTECLRVLKPGGYILAFSSARTYHKLATSIENAGFEIRDQLMWVYGTAFPKSADVGKSLDKKGIENDWHGYKSGLKPAHEPIVMARKPFKGSMLNNMVVNGLGALNIDATRIDYGDSKPASGPVIAAVSSAFAIGGGARQSITGEAWEPAETGRYPSNVIGEISGYQQYFYSPKCNKTERNYGFENCITVAEMLKVIGGTISGNPDECMYRSPTRGLVYMHGLRQEYYDYCLANNIEPDGNTHPCVKPVALMDYLVKMVTPHNRVCKVLDPFMGSGSTGMAVVALGHEFVGCDLDATYVRTADVRITAWGNDRKPIIDLFD